MTNAEVDAQRSRDSLPTTCTQSSPIACSGGARRPLVRTELAAGTTRRSQTSYRSSSVVEFVMRAPNSWSATHGIRRLDRAPNLERGFRPGATGDRAWRPCRPGGGQASEIILIATCRRHPVLRSPSRCSWEGSMSDEWNASLAADRRHDPARRGLCAGAGLVERGVGAQHAARHRQLRLDGRPARCRIRRSSRRSRTGSPTRCSPTSTSSRRSRRTPTARRVPRRAGHERHPHRGRSGHAAPGGVGPVRDALGEANRRRTKPWSMC